jgi:uncharacterized protein Yka (UPF0111/DUF47 family)
MKTQQEISDIEQVADTTKRDFMKNLVLLQLVYLSQGLYL